MSWLGSFVVSAYRWCRTALVRTKPVCAAARRESVICVGCGEEYSVLDKVLKAGDYDVAFLGSIDGAYSEIVHARPDRVILCMRADDERSLLVLSMLNLDPRTSGIPVTTCVAGVAGGRSDGLESEGLSGLPLSSPGLVIH
jgi:hypothetical protein